MTLPCHGETSCSNVQLHSVTACGLARAVMRTSPFRQVCILRLQLRRHVRPLEAVRVRLLARCSPLLHLRTSIGCTVFAPAMTPATSAKQCPVFCLLFERGYMAAIRRSAGRSLKTAACEQTFDC